LKVIKKPVPQHLVETGESFEQKFTPVLFFSGWRIAMLRHSEATDRNLFHQVEQHKLTNEVFILTSGKADLIVCEKGEIPGQTYIFPMKLNVAYNILPSVWHHVIMSSDAHIVIFERSDTSKENSNYYELDKGTVELIISNFLKN
jgi:ureidoglycolate hydrolase